MAIGSLLPVLILTISPYSACHSALGCRISSKLVHLQQRYDVISIFKMAAAAAQFYFRFQIRWRRSFSDASFYQHSRYNYFRFGKTNVCHTGILLPVLICSRHIILHQSAKLHQHRTARGRKWRHVDLQDFLRHLRFYGSNKSPCTTSYRSSIG